MKITVSKDAIIAVHIRNGNLIINENVHVTLDDSLFITALSFVKEMQLLPLEKELISSQLDIKRQELVSGKKVQRLT